MQDTTLTLSPGEELRLAVASSSLVVTLLDGDATMCGAHIKPGTRLELFDTSTAFLTRGGATLQYKGMVSHQEVAHDCRHRDALDSVADVLETSRPRDCFDRDHRVDMRLLESSTNDPPVTTRGPRVLVVGETNTGKRTTTRTLANFALARNWVPTLVDLNNGQCGLSMPGSVAARALWYDTCASTLTVDTALAETVPHRFFYGSVDMAWNPVRMRHCIDLLAREVDDWFARSIMLNASGCVINTCGWINRLGLEILFHAIQCFGIDHVVVLDPDNGDSSANCADTENLVRKLTYAFGNRLRIHAVPKSSDRELELYEFIDVRDDKSPAARSRFSGFAGSSSKRPRRDIATTPQHLQVRRLQQFDPEKLRGMIVAWLAAPPYTSDARRDVQSTWVLSAPVIAFLEVKHVNLLEAQFTLSQPSSLPTKLPRDNNCLLIGKIQRK